MVSRFSLPVLVTGEHNPDVTPPPPARFALLEIRVPRTFQPKHYRHLPPLVACWLNHQQARDLAISLNADVLRRGAGAWHVLVVTGRNQSYGVIRVDAAGSIPSEPHGMPATLMQLVEGETPWKTDALASCDQTNAAILKIARKPSVWNIVIRALTDATPEEAPPVPTSAGAPGKPGPVGPEREHSQSIADWSQPAKWHTEGFGVRTGGAT